MNAITIDFHNTLVECDSWFEIEIRTLVSDVVRRASAEGSFDANQIDYEALDQAYRTLRLAIHDHGMEVAANEAVARILNENNTPLSLAIVQESVDELMREALVAASPVDGAREMLEQLRQHNVTLAVVSSAVHHDFLLWALEKFDLLLYFDLVATSASTGYYKSRPEIYLNTLMELKAEPNTSLHLGDSLRFDVGGAAAAGMKTAWYNRGDGHGVYEGHPKPDTTVIDLADAALPLIALLEEQSGDSQT